MRPGDDELPRWRDTSMDPSALPARAADLVDAARDAPSLSAEALARVRFNVERGGRRSRARAVPLGLRFATLVALVLASVATAKGTMLLWHRYVAVHALTFVDAPPRAPARARTKAPEPAPVIEPIEHQDVPAPIAPEEAAPRPRRSPERRAPADPASEAQALTDALALLRRAHDPRGALAALDRYAQAYPRGVLASEARSARLEALLALDDRRGALALLDERSTFSGRLGAEQLLTRAELRASVGRYADALGDFDRALAPAAPQSFGALVPADLERALYGRAVTLGHLGRDDRARADLEAYQQRFPAGKHAAEVARLLAPDRRP